MIKRFFFAFFAFIGLIIPAAFGFAVLAAPPANPAPIRLPGCERNLAQAATGVAAMQGKFKDAAIKANPESCTATRLYFLEVVKARWFEGAISNYPSLLVINEFLYRNAPTPLFIFAVGLVYYFAPNAKVRLRDVWVGAIVAGLLWRLAFSGFSLLVRETRLTTIHGSIVTVVIFLIWVYMSAVIFLYGCEVTAAYARLRKQLPQSAPAAPAILPAPALPPALPP